MIAAHKRSSADRTFIPKWTREQNRKQPKKTHNSPVDATNELGPPNKKIGVMTMNRTTLFRIEAEFQSQGSQPHKLAVRPSRATT
jgi:hypothetical protein